MFSNKPPRRISITHLFVFVVLAMVMTTVVQADGYLFRDPVVLSSDMNLGRYHKMTFHNTILPSSKNNWLVNGSSGISTSFKGGMAHFRFDGTDNTVSAKLSGMTRFVLSMGLEENRWINVPGSANFYGSQNWQDRYKPMFYLTVGRHW